MEIRKPALPSIDSPAIPGPADRGARTPAPVIPGGDWSSIKPLDLPAALQILLAEVKLALIEAGFTNSAVDASMRSTATLSPTTAAPALVELILRFVPQGPDASPSAFNAVVERLLQAIGRGGGAAIERVVAWRDTPPAIALTVRDVQARAFALLQGDQPALLSRPEWLGIAASVQQLRRRRRRALLLTDTDADHLDVPAPAEPPEPPPMKEGRR